MRGADRVAVAAFAENVVSWVLIDRVVPRQKDAVFGHEVVEDPTGQTTSQPPRGPAPLGENAVVAGGMPRGQRAQVRKRLETVRPPTVRRVAKAKTTKRRKVGLVKAPAKASKRERAGLGKCCWMRWSLRRAVRAWRV